MKRLAAFLETRPFGELMRTWVDGRGAQSPLRVEFTSDVGPRGMMTVVVHWRDELLTLEIDPVTGKWLPVSLRDSFGQTHRAVMPGDDGEPFYVTRVQRELEALAVDWDVEMEKEGYFRKAAQEAVAS